MTSASGSGMRAMLRLLPFPVVGFALHAWLAGGATGWAMPELRLGAAFAVLVLLPGIAIARHVSRPPGGASFAPMWWLGFGVLWNVVLGSVLGFHLLSLDACERLWLPLTIALWLATLAAEWFRRPDPRSTETGTSRAALVAVLLAAALAFLHAAGTGTPVTYYSDSPDHIGTIRRIMETGRPFPTDAFFEGAGALGADPRKGWWHVEVARIARLARTDAPTAWIALSAWIAPLFVLNAAAFGAQLAGAAGSAATAWALLVVWAGNSIWWPMRKAVFSTFLADQLALAALVAVLWDLERPRGRARAAAILLGLAAVEVHLFAAIQFAIVFGALALALAIRDRGAGAPLRRLAGTVGLLAIACGAGLARQAAAGVAPHNLIHTEPQGLLYLTDRMRVVSIGVLWDWMGSLWVLFPLSWWALWRRGRHNAAALSILSTSAGVALVIFNPFAVELLQPRLGYLLMRMIWMVPLAGLLGWHFVALSRAAARRDAGARERAGATAALAALGLWLVPTANEAAASLLHPSSIRAAELAISPLAWRDPMRWMDEHLLAREVVLSDPATSYGIPMLTRHAVVTLMDQHSSPNDTLALRRLLDARDALDPWSAWNRARDLIRRERATVVVLNRRFSEIPGLAYWSPTPEWYGAVRAHLERAPAAFERIYDRAGFTVYRIHPEALDTLSLPVPPRTCVRPYAAGREPVGRRVGAGMPVLLRLTLDPRRAAPGDTVRGLAEWRSPGALPPGSYRVPVRFDRDLPGGFEPPAPIAKPVRKLVERVHHERFRFRADHLPTGGTYGVDLWRPDEVVRDSFTFRVPPDVAPGRYRVEIKMYRQPQYPNFRLSDYFLDRDFYAGIPAGTFDVAGLGRASEPLSPLSLPGH